jgi:hypothetical protein
MTAKRLLCAVAVLFLSSCANYSYAARGPGPGWGQLPFDKDTPRTASQWSFFWGLYSHVWSPLDCGPKVPADQCKQPKDPCDGLGVARFDAQLAWYSVPLAVATLGMAVPLNLTVWCSTQTPVGTGP